MSCNIHLALDITVEHTEGKFVSDADLHDALRSLVSDVLETWAHPSFDVNTSSTYKVTSWGINGTH